MNLHSNSYDLYIHKRGHNIFKLYNKYFGKRFIFINLIEIK